MTTGAKVVAADLFAGAGGTSTGLALACKSLGREIELVAINHWKEAIETHTQNHPWATHICANLESLNPRDVVPSGHLNLLVASPECVFFSVAHGARPINDQRRSSPWLLLRWLDFLNVDSMLVENVPEFQNWCRLNSKQRPVEKEKGKIFREWTEAIRSHGYSVDYQILNSADYGDATSRKRLFLIARKGNKPVQFPQQTHSRNGKVPGTKTWKAAREIIDWTIKGQSIYERDKPLAPNTMARIREGLRRFGGDEVRPFLVLMEHGGGVRSVDDPLPTITTARGGAMGVAEPFILPPEGIYRGNAPRSVEDPLQTITQRGGGSLIQPFVVTTDRARTNRSLPRSTEEPLPTVVAGNKRIGLVEPYLVKYCSTGGAYSVDEPTPTLTTKDRLALVQPVVIRGKMLDIRFRMLIPKELSRATGFPANYTFVGNRTEIVRQIGNAVTVNMARALCETLLSKPRRSVLTATG